MIKIIKRIVFLCVVLAGVMLNKPVMAAELVQGEYVFTINKDGTAALSEYKGKATNVSVPSNLYVDSFVNYRSASSVKIPNTVKVDGVRYQVTAIAKNAFKNNTTIKKVTIGSNINTIGSGAFSGCKKLKKVVMGENIKTVGSSAFNGCKSLTKIVLNSKVKKIGKKAFYNCKKLKTIEINSIIIAKKNIGKNAFKGIYSKATVSVPKGMVVTYKMIITSKGASKKIKVVSK